MKIYWFLGIILWFPHLYGQPALENTDSFEKEIAAKLNLAEKKQTKKEVKNKVKEVQDASNRLDMAAVVDTVGSWSLSPTRPEGIEDRFFVREAALAIFNDIDHLARGTWRFNIETEDGLNYELGIEEAYFEFLSLPYGLYARLGKFLIDAGRLNTIHRHAWNFVHTPLVHKKFWGGTLNDAGAEISFLMPWNFYQEWRLGIFNGSGLGEGPFSTRKSYPMLVARLKHFFPIGSRAGTQFGFTGIRYAPDKEKGNYHAYYGFDFMLKWQKNNLRSFSFTTEVWHKEEYTAAKLTTRQVGAYFSLHWQFLQTWVSNLRYDFYGPWKWSQINQELSFGITWKPSGFAYYRTQWSRQMPYQETPQYVLRVQADFVVGYHPAHKY